MTRAVITALALVVALAVGAHTAFGYFLAPVVGSATAEATTLPAGPTPRVTIQGRTATVSWDAVSLTTGIDVPAFAVTRSAVGTATPAPATGSCSGTLTQRTCTEARLPSGTWTYAVSARVGSNWLGAAGAASTAITIAPPALSLDRTTVGATPPATIAGTLTGFDTAEPLAFRLDDPLTGTVLSGTPAAASADGTATVKITLPASLTAGTRTIYAVGSASDPSQAAATLLVDLTPPTTTDSTAAVGNAWLNAAQSVTLTPTDSGAGVAATYWTIDGTTPTLASSTGTSIPITTDGIYTPRYFSVDRVDNREQVRTAATTIRIDRTAPTVAAPSAGSATIGNGQQLTTTATDPTVNAASSGIAAVAYFACPGTCTPTPGAAGTISIGSSQTGTTYGVAWTSQPSDGKYSIAARATDEAGNATLSATTVRTLDNNGPVLAVTLADATANQAGYINGNANFYAYANVSDAGAGVDTTTIKADLSGQCGTGCVATSFTATGGPFTVLTASGTATYAYRSAALRAVSSSSTSFTASASDQAGTSTTTTGTVTLDQAGNPGTPVAVALANGVAAAAFATCTTTVNGYVNAARAPSSTITVTTSSNAPANGVVRVTVTDGTTSVTTAAVVAAAGTQMVTFAGLNLTGLADGTLTLSTLEYSPGGKSTSSTRSQTVTKLTTTPSVTVGNLVYTDNTAPTADQASSTSAVGPNNGYLAFTQTAGTAVGTTYASAVLSATGRLTALPLASETSRPTYSVAAVDAACNPSAAATWSPAASR